MREVVWAQKDANGKYAALEQKKKAGNNRYGYDRQAPLGEASADREQPEGSNVGYRQADELGCSCTCNDACN